MNKKFILLFSFIFITFLHATTLIKYYHVDYKAADRNVFVFDSKPEYQIKSVSDAVTINYSNTNLDYDIKPEIYENSNVIKSVEYQEGEQSLTVIFGLVKSSYGAPYIETLEFAENKQNYKVVIDVIKVTEPKSYNDAQNLAAFYKLVGKKRKAAKILSDYNSANNITPNAEAKPKKPFDSTKIVNQEIAKVKKSHNFNNLWQTAKKSIRLFPPMFYLIILLAIILIILAIKIIIHSMKKDVGSKIANFWHPTRGFGSDQFRKEVITKLLDLNWTEEAIAREMQLRPKIVKSIISDILKDQ